MIASPFRILWFLLALVSTVSPTAAAAPAIVVLGDSISAGYGLDNPDQGWVSLLQQKLRAGGRSFEIVNAGISGDTSAGGLARLPPLLERHHPAVLVLELGANDGLRGLPPAQIQSNLAAIIEQAQAARARVLLLGMRIPPNYGKRYNDLFEAVFPALAQAHRLPYVPFLLDGVGGSPDLMQADGLHPNLQAQPVLMQRVWERLEPLL